MISNTSCSLASVSFSSPPHLIQSNILKFYSKPLLPPENRTIMILLRGFSRHGGYNFFYEKAPLSRLVRCNYLWLLLVNMGCIPNNFHSEEILVFRVPQLRYDVFTISRFLSNQQGERISSPLYLIRPS